MTHGFTSTQLKGIYTTKGRADAVNELITATTRYANPGTLLLAYDDIPMVNYATLLGGYGRLGGVMNDRDVLYLWTSNRDGRSSFESSDDRVIRVDLK